MLKLAAAALVLAFACVSARADGWRLDGNTAGYVADDGGFAGLWLACGGNGGGATLFVSTGGARLEAGIDRTVAITVDGIAFLHRMRADAGSNEPALRRALPAGEVQNLANALGRGAKAEVAMPAGRFALPLKGSGKALQGFLAACR